ncbi:MAG: 6-carboxytetrahydropterin synthase [Desulfurococcales archaeon]|nr:6-carboxytetrahydropterin synthase [Desulfurococcales archaeon]
MSCVYYIGVTGVSFEAAHITSSAESGEYGLHGHTYRVDVEICSSELNDYHMVMDITVLKKIVSKIARELDHKLLLGGLQLEERIGEYPCVIFEDVPQVTMEALARYFVARISQELRSPQYELIGKVCVTVWQGLNEYAKYCSSGKDRGLSTSSS